MNIAIVVDSTSYLPEDLLKKNNIYTIPLNIILGEESYREGIDLTTDEFFTRMREMDELPRTSQPSIGDYILLLESLRRDGYTDVISFHLSAGISGTYQSAISAGDSVEGINLHAVDTEIACYVQGFMALYAAQNKDKMSIDELLDTVNEMKRQKHTDAYFVVDTLNNLHKGGRLSNAQALIGSMLKVKPVLKFEDGKIVPYEKIRTMKKALKKVESELETAFSAHEKKDITAVVIHSNAEAAGLEWKAQLEEKFPEVTFRLSYFGPVIATHLGEGALGIGYTTYKIDTE